MYVNNTKITKTDEKDFYAFDIVLFDYRYDG